MIPSAEIFKAKILIVDDQEANILLMEQLLRGAGYTDITTTRAPFPVRELHRKNRYALILLDLQMPGMDGFQVMDALKEIEPGAYLPVLVVTAQPDHRMRAVKAGAKDFISKPFDIAELLHRVRTMLEVRLLHDRLAEQDAPERPQSDEAQRRGESHFRLAAHVQSDAVWDWNLLDKTLWWSDGFRIPFGYASGEIEASVASWMDRIHPEERSAVMEGLQGAIDAGSESWGAEYRFQRRDGTYTDVKDYGLILRDAADRAVRMVGRMQDITEQKRAEAAKQHARLLEHFGTRAWNIASELSGLLTDDSRAASLARELLAQAEVLRESPDRPKPGDPGPLPGDSAV